MCKEAQPTVKVRMGSREMTRETNWNRRPSVSYRTGEKASRRLKQAQRGLASKRDEEQPRPRRGG